MCDLQPLPKLFQWSLSHSGTACMSVSPFFPPHVSCLSGRWQELVFMLLLCKSAMPELSQRQGLCSNMTMSSPACPCAPFPGSSVSPVPRRPAYPSGRFLSRQWSQEWQPAIVSLLIGNCRLNRLLYPKKLGTRQIWGTFLTPPRRSLAGLTFYVHFQTWKLQWEEIKWLCFSILKSVSLRKVGGFRWERSSLNWGAD